MSLICLACGQANRLGASACQACQSRLGPHADQLQRAVCEFRDGNLDRDGLDAHYGRFVDLWQPFEERWGAVLGGTLANAYGRLLASLDALEEGYADLDGICEGLTQFGRLARQAGAAMLCELEAEDLHALKLGALHDYSA